MYVLNGTLVGDGARFSKFISIYVISRGFKLIEWLILCIMLLGRGDKIGLIGLLFSNRLYVQVVWRLQDGKMKDFSVRSAWDSIRTHRNEVTWFFVVCFSSSIPRYGFHLWLVMRKRLKTHDELKQKDVGNNVDLNLLRCPICKTVTPPFLHIAAEANLGYYFKKPLPEDILGVTALRDTGSHYPKGCWESLPEEILGATTQRDTGSLYPKRCWKSLPKEMLGVFTQRDAFMWVPLP
ncbi:reverse transcriptase domain, reverse transcriptase zinc-binding domain protein [Tanacetum coccineum]